MRNVDASRCRCVRGSLYYVPEVRRNAGEHSAFYDGYAEGRPASPVQSGRRRELNAIRPRPVDPPPPAPERPPYKGFTGVTPMAI